MYWCFVCRSIPKSSKQKCLTGVRRRELAIQLEHFKDGRLTDINSPVLALIQSSDCCWWPLRMRSSRAKGKQWEHTGSCGGVQECDTCPVQLSPTVSGKQRRLSAKVLQFTLPPQEGRRSKAMASNYPGDSRVRVDERRGKGEREGGVFLPGVGWWGQVRRRRTARCQRPQMKGRPNPATRHCGAALETDSRCCCPPRTHTSPPALGTYHGLLEERQKERWVRRSVGLDRTDTERVFTW